MNSKLSFVIAHCYSCNPKTAWYPQFKQHFEQLGHQVLIPALPGNDRPQAAQWQQALNQSLDQATNKVVLIGHSLGSRAILQNIYDHQADYPLVVLIGPLSNDLTNARRANGIMASFFTKQFDRAQINNKVHKLVIIHSKDDNRVDYQDNGYALAEEFSAQLICPQGHKHFLNQQSAEYLIDIFTQLIG